MPFCSHCGADVTTPFCPICGTKNGLSLREPGFVDVTGATTVSYSAQSHNVAVKAVEVGFHRSPLQILLLGFASFGLYTVYYLARGRRFAQRRLGHSVESPWAVLRMIVPILNLIYFYGGFNLICERVRASQVNPVVPFGVTAIAVNFCMFLGYAPAPYYLLFLAGPVFLAVIHVSVAKAERVDDPQLQWPKWHWLEITILIVGFCVIGLGLAGEAFDDQHPSPQFIGCIAFGMLVSIVSFWWHQSAHNRKYVEMPGTST